MLYLVYILLAVFVLASLLLARFCYRQRRIGSKLQAQLHDFTGFVHDMRTPLSLVKSSLDELEEAGNLSEGLQKSLAVLRKNLTRLLDMSELLLDWQKAEMQASALRLVSCDLNVYLLLDAARLLNRQINIVHAPGHAFIAYTDENGLPQFWETIEPDNHGQPAQLWTSAYAKTLHPFFYTPQPENKVEDIYRLFISDKLSDNERTR